MKKLLALVLCVLMMTALCSTAMAATATYSSTRTFLTYMDEIGIKYTNAGIDSDGDEKVVISNRDSDINFTYDFVLFFDKNNQNCYIYIWNIINYNASDYLNVLRMVNELNTTYRYVTFEADTSDNTITLRMDLIYRGNDVDEIVWEAILRMANILGDTYPTMAQYDK